MAETDALQRRLKRATDLLLAVPALLLLAPLMALLALCIRATMGRPVLFRQQRPGLHEAPFTLYKFRTMRPPGDGYESDADRTTRLGRWLRRTSLDELPELLNVVRGRMSLVGPRPLLPRYLPYYTERERLRHTVRPGLTGWAQINGRNLLSWDERLALDAWYVEHWSLRLDLHILLRTPRAVLGQHGVLLDQRSRLPDLDEARSLEGLEQEASRPPPDPRPPLQMPAPCTVLLSSAGRRAGLLACFRADAEALGLALRIIAVDLYPELSAACRLADAAYPVAPCDTPRYLEQLYEICRRERVDLVIPTIDPELYPLSGAVGGFAALPTRIVVSSPEAVALARSKRRTADRLRAAGIPTPRTLSLADVRADPGSLDWPLLVKPDAGSGSSGIRRLHAPDELACLPDDDGYVAQELWPGTEYTVNLFVDAGGAFRCAIPHERREVRAGEVSKGITRRVPALEDAARRLAAALPGLRGPACFQAMVRDDGRYAVFELNARFGGGYPLAHAAGAPFTRWLLEEATGLPRTAHNAWEDGLLMLRYDAACFERLPQPS